MLYLAALLAAAALVAGCGSDEESGPGVPEALVRQIAAQLDLVQDRIDVTRETDKIGSCNDVEGRSIPDIERLIAQAPDDTDPEIVDTLEQGVVRLRELASQECSDLEDRVGQETDTTPTETTPPEPEPETETEPETTPETTPSEKVPPGQEKKDKGKGNDGDATPPDDSGGGGGAPAPLPGDG